MHAAINIIVKTLPQLYVSQRERTPRLWTQLEDEWVGWGVGGGRRFEVKLPKTVTSRA